MKIIDVYSEFYQDLEDLEWCIGVAESEYNFYVNWSCVKFIEILKELSVDLYKDGEIKIILKMKEED